VNRAFLIERAPRPVVVPLEEHLHSLCSALVWPRTCRGKAALGSGRPPAFDQRARRGKLRCWVWARAAGTGSCPRRGVQPGHRAAAGNRSPPPGTDVRSRAWSPCPPTVCPSCGMVVISASSASGGSPTPVRRVLLTRHPGC